jgi:hypothetical protein
MKPDLAEFYSLIHLVDTPASALLLGWPAEKGHGTGSRKRVAEKGRGKGSRKRVAEKGHGKGSRKRVAEMGHGKGSRPWPTARA